MKRTILIFGGLSALILLLFQLGKLSLLYTDSLGDWLLLISGVLFILVGYLINHFLYKPKSSHPIEFNQSALDNTGLSKQEYKVLKLIADGYSNVEIGQQLYISESTVKSHVSNVLSKLNAKRRTEAIRIGRDLQIL